MNLWLLAVSMQMCDPYEHASDDEMDAHTSDDEMDETDGEMLVDLYAVDIRADISVRLLEEHWSNLVFNGFKERWRLVMTVLTCFACEELFLDDCMTRWYKIMVCFQAGVSVLWKLLAYSCGHVGVHNRLGRSEINLVTHWKQLAASIVMSLMHFIRCHLT